MRATRIRTYVVTSGIKNNWKSRRCWLLELGHQLPGYSEVSLICKAKDKVKRSMIKVWWATLYIDDDSIGNKKEIPLDMELVE